MSWPFTNYIMTRKESFIFFVISLTLFTIPIMINNYHYIDDSWRTLAASNGWTGEGRYGANFLLEVIDVSRGTPNSFPLTMFMAIVMMSTSLTCLLFLWFKKPCITHCFILLPLWCNPFFLQILSYQYDCFTVSMSLSLAIFALILVHTNSIKGYIFSALLIVLFLSIYQVTVNFFMGILALNAVMRLCEGEINKKNISDSLSHFFILVIAILIYYIVFFHAIKNDRGGMIIPFPQEFIERLRVIFSRAFYFVTITNSLFFSIPLALSVLQIVRVIKNNINHHAIYLLFFLLSVLTLILCGPGIAIFVKNFEYNSGARMLIGFGVVFSFVLKLSNDFLDKKNENAKIIVIIPALIFLSFSYIYGSVMNQKKYNEEKIIQSLYYDIISNDVIIASRHIFIDMVSNHYSNLFPESCTERQNPALSYIFEAKYILLPEQLVGLGLWNVRPLKGTPDDKGIMIIDRPYWAISKNKNNDSYIYFKNTKKPSLNCDSAWGKILFHS
jgi:hypothetical protein